MITSTPIPKRNDNIPISTVTSKATKQSTTHFPNQKLAIAPKPIPNSPPQKKLRLVTSAKPSNVASPNPINPEPKQTTPEKPQKPMSFSFLKLHEMPLENMDPFKDIGIGNVNRQPTLNPHQQSIYLQNSIMRGSTPTTSNSSSVPPPLLKLRKIVNAVNDRNQNANLPPTENVVPSGQVTPASASKPSTSKSSKPIW